MTESEGLAATAGEELKCKLAWLRDRCGPLFDEDEVLETAYRLGTTDLDLAYKFWRADLDERIKRARRLLRRRDRSRERRVPT